MVRENTITEIRAAMADPVVRQKLASASGKRWADPSIREKIIASGEKMLNRRELEREVRDRRLGNF